jgi:hypothetical protein
MLHCVLRLPQIDSVLFAATGRRCSVIQVMHGSHCCHGGRTSAAGCRARLSAAAGRLQDNGSLHGSSTRRSAWSARLAQRDSQRNPGCRSACRRAAAAAMHSVARGGLCKGGPLDTTQLSTKNIRCCHSNGSHCQQCSQQSGNAQTTIRSRVHD